MTIEERARAAGRGTVAVFESSTDVVAQFDRLEGRRQSQRRARTLAVAVAAVFVVFAVLAVQSTWSRDAIPEPMVPVPGLDVGDVPVWYDDAGLHRGDTIEQTPVDLREMDGGAIKDGALALVRTGALYLDPATDDVWFHPWGGEPRIVGRDSSTGPSATADGDIAAWVEGGEVVVFDTVTDREIARFAGRAFSSYTCHTGCSEHEPPGNGFLDVSAERVVWTSDDLGGPSYGYEVSTAQTSLLTYEALDPNERKLVDAHGEAAVYGIKGNAAGEWSLVLDMPGMARREYPNVDPVDNLARVSPSGNYVLSEGARVEGARGGEVTAVIDTQTGNVLPLSQRFSWIAWSYGDIALLNPSNGNSSANVHRLLACDPVEQDCVELPVQGPVLMPTS